MIHPSSRKYLGRVVGLIAIGLIGILGIIASNGDQPSWKPLGTESFSDGPVHYLSLFVDAGTPYVAYSDEAHGNKLTVKKYSGNQWLTVGNAGFSYGEVTWNTDIYVAGGTPYVAYQDKSTSPPGQAVVMRFTGTVWENVDRPNMAPGFTADAAAYVNLYVAGGAPPIPFVAFQDWAQDKKLTVMKWNNVNWVYVGGEPAVSAGIANNVSMDVFLGSPYVAYTDQLSPDNPGKATVREYDGNSWVDVGNAGFSAAEAPYISLDLNENRVPYVVYQDWGNGKKATVMRRAAANWQAVGSPGFSSGLVGHPLVISVVSDTPYVAYRDDTRNDMVTVKKFNGSTWVDVGSPQALTTIGGVAYGYDFVVAGGKPFLAFVDATKGRKVSVLVYE